MFVQQELKWGVWAVPGNLYFGKAIKQAHMTYKLPPRHKSTRNLPTSTRNLPGKDPTLITNIKPQTLEKGQKSSNRVPRAAITLGCYFTP